jgi:putative oxidoreductase
MRRHNIERVIVKIATTLVRILLGLMFTVFGLNQFHPFIPQPPVVPANAMAFSMLMFSTHYIYLVAGVQTISGILLLANRYVTLALVLLGAMLANILTFHFAMWPQALVPMPLIALLLWLWMAWQHRASLAPIFIAKES